MTWKTTKYLDQASIDKNIYILGYEPDGDEREQLEKDNTLPIRYKQDGDSFMVQDYFQGAWNDINLNFIPNNYLDKKTNKYYNPHGLYARDMPTHCEHYIYKAILENEKNDVLKKGSNKTDYGNIGVDTFTLRIPNLYKSLIKERSINVTKFINDAIKDKLIKDGLLTDQDE